MCTVVVEKDESDLWILLEFMSRDELCALLQLLDRCVDAIPLLMKRNICGSDLFSLQDSSDFDRLGIHGTLASELFDLCLSWKRSKISRDLVGRALKFASEKIPENQTKIRSLSTSLPVTSLSISPDMTSSPTQLLSPSLVTDVSS